MVRLLRRGQYALALACGLLIVAFILATMSVGLERMRLPMMLALFLLAASAILATRAGSNDTSSVDPAGRQAPRAP